MQFIDAITRVKSKLKINSSGNNFWSDTLIKQEINDAQDWLSEFFEWSILQKSFSRTSIAGQTYYSYPDTTNAPYSFKDDTIKSLYVNGTPYDKWRYDDFNTFIKDPQNANRTDIKIFADYGRTIFIFPVINDSVSRIEALGNVQSKTMVQNTDLTIFDGASKGFDRIIIKKALENLIIDDPKRRDSAYFKISSETDAINLVKKANQKNALKKKVIPTFERIDFIGNTSNQNGYDNNIGNFNNLI
jgi:hypothetical protein